MPNAELAADGKLAVWMAKSGSGDYREAGRAGRAEKKIKLVITQWPALDLHSTVQLLDVIVFCLTCSRLQRAICDKSARLLDLSGGSPVYWTRLAVQSYQARDIGLVN